MSLLGGILGIAGGILGRNSEKKAINAQNEYNSPAQIRARAEAAGFNPLLFVGPGVGLQQTTGGSNYMGAALAESGLMIADAVAKRRNLGQLSQLQRVNQRLQDQVTSLTLRPKVGGIYAQREATPSLRAALGYAERSSGGNDVVSTRDGVSGVGVAGRPDDPTGGIDPLLSVDPIDPRRGVDDAPVKTHSGAMVVDNPLTGRLYFPTLDGDEVLQWYDYPTLLGGYAINKSFRYGQSLRRYADNDAFDAMAKADAEAIARARKRPRNTLRFDPNHRDGYYWSY